MKKRNFILLFVLLSLSVLLFFRPKTTAPALFGERADLWIVSDPHLLATELYDTGSAFEKMQQTAAGKELRYQEDSWQSLIEQAKKEQPDALIVTGDLTFNGEKQSAETLVGFFEALEQEGVAVFVLPGNHDIHDGWARKFIGDEQFTTSQISPKDFETLFSSSYERAIEKDPYSLSYIIQATDDSRLFLLDTNIYTRETSRRKPMTGGKLRKESLQWLEEQLEKAKQEAQTPVIFMHHNLLKHNSLVYQGFVLNNADELHRMLQTYQVPLVFSGHIHAQDILQNPQSGIIEITTGSFSIAPQTIGKLQLTQNELIYQRSQLDSSKQPFPEEADSYATYLEQLFIEDGQKMAYGMLIEQGIYDSEILDPIAEFVGQVNLRFFSGDDFLTDEEVLQLKQTAGYQLLKAQDADFLSNYVDSIIQDTNLPDDRLHLKKTATWELLP